MELMLLRKLGAPLRQYIKHGMHLAIATRRDATRRVERVRRVLHYVLQLNGIRF